jgi:hypothetical protein
MIVEGVGNLVVTIAGCILALTVMHAVGLAILWLVIGGLSVLSVTVRLVVAYEVSVRPLLVITDRRALVLWPGYRITRQCSVARPDYIVKRREGEHGTIDWGPTDPVPRRVAVPVGVRSLDLLARPLRRGNIHRKGHVIFSDVPNFGQLESAIIRARAPYRSGGVGSY